MANMADLDAQKSFVRTDELVAETVSPSGKAILFSVKGKPEQKDWVPKAHIKTEPNGDCMIRADTYRQKFSKWVPEQQTLAKVEA